ncbi:MAG: alpha/beta hydrolase, partial [Desulfuromonadales bacterium]|nr:alpha/beta hydrolase [Desulfuromonadales bacterium]
RAVVAINPAAVVGPDFGYMTPERFFGKAGKHEGWGKYNKAYWLTDYEDFARFFITNIFPEPHSTKQIEDAVEWSGQTTGQVLARTVEARLNPSPSVDLGEAMYRSVACPVLVMHGTDDRIIPHGR